HTVFPLKYNGYLLFSAVLAIVTAKIKQRGNFMANEEHLQRLKRSVPERIQWRRQHRDFRPDLSKADLSGANLYNTDVLGINLSEADLSEADLSGANLRNAYLSGANLSGANLSKALQLHFFGETLA